MRYPILQATRQALGRLPNQTIPPRPPILPPRQPAEQSLSTPSAAEISLLFTELHKLAANARQIFPADLPGALSILVQEQNIHKAALWNTSLLNQLEIAARLSALGVEIVPPNADKHLLAECDLGITEADFALPETGTLGLLSSAQKPRAISLLPRVHLALLSPQALRHDLHQVFAEAKAHHYLVLITGPSRTADIELTVTLGVHGPKSLYVWIIEP